MSPCFSQNKSDISDSSTKYNYNLQVFSFEWCEVHMSNSFVLETCLLFKNGWYTFVFDYLEKSLSPSPSKTKLVHHSRS